MSDDDLIDLEDLSDDELREFFLARYFDCVAAQKELVKRLNGRHSV